jgi:hypothetical protein
VVEQGSFIIAAETLVSGKPYRREYVFDSKRFAPSTWQWLASGLSDLAEVTRVTPMSTNAAWGLNLGLDRLDQIDRWHDLSTSTVPSAVTSRERLELLKALETFLARDKLSALAKNRTFLQTCRFLDTYIFVDEKNSPLHAVATPYTSHTLSYESKSRMLISELPGSMGVQGSKRVPLAALRHENLSELQAQTSRLIDSDIRAIEQACMSALDVYETACAKLEDLRTTAIPPNRERQLRDLARGQNINKKLARLDDCEAYELCTLYVQIAAGIKPPLDNSSSGALLGGRALAVRLCEITGYWEHTEFLAMARLDLEPPLEILVACALPIQLKTKWNRASVIELDASRITGQHPDYCLQSVKSKTQDHTPIVYLARPGKTQENGSEDLGNDVYLGNGDICAARAIRTLLEILQRRKNVGSVDHTEVRLWLTARRGVFETPVAFALPLTAFQDRFGLPRFSWEMVRSQALASVGVAKGGFRAAVEAAGHANPWTTVKYLDTVMLRNLNAANSLEFERRFDQAIKYRHDGRKRSRQADKSMPVGDGTTCRDPQSPPEAAWIAEGMCGGLNCHTGSGCKNNRIELDDCRIEEVARTKRYYESSSERLFEANPKAFSKYHLPSLIFNLSLYRAIEHGPYRHLLRRYE